MSTETQNNASVRAEPVGYVSKQAIERFQDGRHADIYPSIEELVHEFFDATPMALYAAPVAAQAQPSSDRAMLLKLMAAFDMEVWNCPNCTAAEETKDCDSAIMLREYLSNNPVIAQQPVSGADVTPQNVADALDLMDAILAPERRLLAVPYTSATVTAAREDLALIRAALARQEEKQ